MITTLHGRDAYVHHYRTRKEGTKMAIDALTHRCASIPFAAGSLRCLFADTVIFGNAYEVDRPLCEAE
jgi:hypothetical protein